MKYNKLFRILAVAVVLALLMIALPAAPAVATSVVTLDIYKGAIGDKVTVDGAGFIHSVAPDHYKFVDIYVSSDQFGIGDEINYYENFYTIVKHDVTVDENGSFTKIINVPAVLGGGEYGSENIADVLGGTYYIYITYSEEVNIEAYVEFTVLGVTGLEPAGGPVGTRVTIGGLGFDSGDDLSVQYDGGGVSIVSGDRRVKNSGIFSSSIDIPESVIGSHTITVSDEGGHSGQAQFVVTPQIGLDPNPASVAEEVTVNGTGFSANVDIFVYFDGYPLDHIGGDDNTDEKGSFVSSFLVPTDVLSGSYYIEVEDDDGNSADTELEVGAGITVEPVTTTSSPGHVGETVILTGNGFTPGADVEITYETDPIHLDTVEADASGDFVVTVTIPASDAGEHTIIADDGSGNTKEVTFIMESEAPATPSLLLPADNDKLEDWAFSWGEVSDDSLPVTYELQIATSGQFGEESIILYKIEINSSKYSLTAGEQPESTGEDAPYYWRVRAKDAASNTSDWTSGRAFTVSGFHMPLWLIITLIGVGVVGLFLLGLWLGRRSNLDEYYY